MKLNENLTQSAATANGQITDDADEMISNIGWETLEDAIITFNKKKQYLSHIQACLWQTDISEISSIEDLEGTDCDYPCIDYWTRETYVESTFDYNKKADEIVRKIMTEYFGDPYEYREMECFWRGEDFLDENDLKTYYEEFVEIDNRIEDALNKNGLLNEGKIYGNKKTARGICAWLKRNKYGIFSAEAVNKMLKDRHGFTTEYINHGNYFKGGAIDFLISEYHMDELRDIQREIDKRNAAKFDFDASKKPQSNNKPKPRKKVVKRQSEDDIELPIGYYKDYSRVSQDLLDKDEIDYARYNMFHRDYLDENLTNAAASPSFDFDKQSEQLLANDKNWLVKLDELIRKYGGSGYGRTNRLGDGETEGEMLETEIPLMAVVDLKGEDVKMKDVKDVEDEIFMSLNPPSFEFARRKYYLRDVYRDNFGGYDMDFCCCPEDDRHGTMEVTLKRLRDLGVSYQEAYCFFLRTVELRKKYSQYSKDQRLHENLTATAATQQTDIEKGTEREILLRVIEDYFDKYSEKCWETFHKLILYRREGEEIPKYHKRKSSLNPPVYIDGVGKEWMFDMLSYEVEHNFYRFLFWKQNTRKVMSEEQLLDSNVDLNQMLDYLKKVVAENNKEINESVKEDKNVEPQPNEVQPKKKPFYDHRNSDGQECAEVGDYGENVYLEDCPFFMGKDQVAFFKMVQLAKEKHTVKDPDDFINKARMNENLTASAATQQNDLEDEANRATISFKEIIIDGILHNKIVDCEDYGDSTWFISFEDDPTLNIQEVNFSDGWSEYLSEATPYRFRYQNGELYIDYLPVTEVYTTDDGEEIDTEDWDDVSEEFDNLETPTQKKFYEKIKWK